MSSNQLQSFTNTISESFQDNGFIKLTVSNNQDKSSDLKTVTLKKIETKAGSLLSFTYRHLTNDITKNHSLEESIEKINQFIAEGFKQIDLFTDGYSYHFKAFKAGKYSLKKKVTENSSIPARTHDKKKNRLIKTEGNLYLQSLGVTTSSGKVKSDMQDKYKQINKYIEIIDGIIRSTDFGPQYNIVDMGAGKGYLTLSLYDYLSNVLGQKPNIVGVEMRPELVKKGNELANDSDFKNLTFKKGTIQDTEIPEIDMLIALHACDTATDDAIYKGIKADASVIICAPCCHKQVRKSMAPNNELESIAKFGILKERQSEILTDTIRALVLEAHGYKTKVFEFIETEHTPKNVLIVGIRSTKKTVKSKQDIINKINGLKEMHGVEYQHLERLLNMS